MEVPHFRADQLVALEDTAGFVLGLGIVVENDPAAKTVVLHTPLNSMEKVNALRLGDLLLDRQTCQDRRM